MPRTRRGASAVHACARASESRERRPNRPPQRTCGCVFGSQGLLSCLCSTFLCADRAGTQLAQKLAPRRSGAPQTHVALPLRRSRALPSRNASISCMRASIATSSAQRSTTRPALNRSRLYISSVSPPRSRSRSSRTSSSNFRSRLSSRGDGATYPAAGRPAAALGSFLCRATDEA